MFGKRRKQSGGHASPGGTLLGAGSICEGNLQGESAIRIDGYFKGGLSCAGRVAIGVAGEVEADIDVAEVYVEGQVRGVVRAERVELAHRARLVGDLTTHRLAITAGAWFQGGCRMNEEENPELGSASRSTEGPRATPKGATGVTPRRVAPGTQ